MTKLTKKQWKGEAIEIPDELWKRVCKVHSDLDIYLMHRYDESTSIDEFVINLIDLGLLKYEGRK